ncbi:MAG: glycosyltransferase [bacterium]|nr:glycosyltransferase [bacterium]
MFIIETVLLVSLVLYTIFCLIISVGVLLGDKINEDFQPSVTILIPARNEEKNIGSCLDSIKSLDYPEDRFEVIVIDDHSDDSTAEIASEKIRDLDNYRLIKLSELENAGTGKIGGLIEGYKSAAGEIVFQTDADCRVPSTWIKTVLRKFSENTGVVGGLIYLRSKENTLFSRIQSLDWLYLVGIGAGANRVGFPLSCIGNNIAVRKKAYEDTGGYTKIPFSITEDFALFKAIVRSGWKAGFSVSKDSLVESSPPETIKDLIRQRIRWSSGGIQQAGYGIVLLATAFVFHFSVIAGIIARIDPVYWLTAVLVSFLVDSIFLFAVTKKIAKLNTLRYLFLFEIYYYFYTTALGVLSPFMRSVTWKGRKIKF